MHNVGWAGKNMGGVAPVRASARRSAWRECAAPMPKAKCLPPHEGIAPRESGASSAPEGAASPGKKGKAVAPSTGNASFGTPVRNDSDQKGGWAGKMMGGVGGLPPHEGIAPREEKISSGADGATRHGQKEDPLWHGLRQAATTAAAAEPLLNDFLHAAILNQLSFPDALAHHLAHRLADEATLPAAALRDLFAAAHAADPSITAAVRADLAAYLERDPACTELLTPFLHYKGFHALQSWRLTAWMWRENRRPLALLIQSRISERLGVDIHPGARIGAGIMMDHATGVVIGETAVVEDNVSMLHGVTLGGTGKESGDRHPKVRRGCLLSAGATVLGNIEIGECARIGAGSIVLRNVPPYCTAVGVPARLIHCPGSGEEPALRMDHTFPQEPDYSI